MKILLIAWVAALALVLSACPEPIRIIVFECPNLERAIRRANGYTGGETGPIYPADVLGITVINASMFSVPRDQPEPEVFNKEHEISGNPISRSVIASLAGIEHLINLEVLYLDGNQVSDLSPLRRLNKLQELWIVQNQVSDISPLQHLTTLQKLFFSQNQVFDITPLQNLINLQRLFFDNNQVSDISPLQHLTNLRLLSFGNQVHDISPLQHLINLERLFFDGNQVSDLTPLQHLTNLWDIHLNDNQVSDISALVANTGLGNGSRIFMRNNYLDLTPGSQNMNDINTLIGRGVNVEYEPQN